MFHANLQAAALVQHETADLRFAVAGLKQNHMCTFPEKKPNKTRIVSQLTTTACY